MGKWEVYGWAEVFKIAWSFVGDTHSSLPWTVEVEAVVFSEYPSKQKNNIRHFFMFC